jgi:hypothetical protein
VKRRTALVVASTPDHGAAIAANQAKIARAVHLFDKAREDLEAASEAQEAIAQQIEAEVDALMALRMEAIKNADSASLVADKMRDLMP